MRWCEQGTQKKRVQKMWLFVGLVVLVAAAPTYQLPNVCLCGPTPQPTLLTCSFRNQLGSPFLPCVLNTTTRLVTSEGEQIACACAGGFPPCLDLTCFASLAVSSALYAVLEPPAAGSIVDVYTGLEYLYGENAELLVAYRSREGLYATTLRRHGAANAASGQVFWYGMSPLAEMLVAI
jgi:hypothetical protein